MQTHISFATCVVIKEENGEYFWSSAQQDNFYRMIWEQIPKSLYDELAKFGGVSD